MPQTKTRRPAPKVPTKTRKNATGASLIELPEHFKVTEPELAVLSRLVRVMRQKDSRGAYWLGPFIEWLLYLDVTSPGLDYVTSKFVLTSLSEMAGEALLTNGSAFIKAAIRKCPGISFVSGTSAVQPVPGEPRWDMEMNPASEEEQFYQLLRLWRKDHPEPAKKIEHPVGRLGREESGD